MFDWLQNHALGVAYVLWHLCAAGFIIYLLQTQYLNLRLVAWMLLTWFLPPVGILGYILFSARPRPRYMPSSPPHFPHTVQMAEQNFSSGNALATCAKNLGQPLFTWGTEMQLLRQTKDIVEQYVKTIDKARHYLLLTTYILKKDRVGMPILKALHRAKKRGVQLHVLYDVCGTYCSWPPSFARFDRHYIRPFLPLKNKRFLPLLNTRMHAKLLCADGKAALVGSMNVASLLGKETAGIARDAVIFCKGPLAAQVQSMCAYLWRIATDEDLPYRTPPTSPEHKTKNPTLARLIYRDSGRAFWALSTILEMKLNTARRSIRIWTPYFLPTSDLLHVLLQAIWRGVKIDVILPQRSNLTLADRPSRLLAERLMLAGGRIHISPPPFDHTKIIVIDDDWATCGSMNLDGRSLLVNVEANLEIMGKQAVAPFIKAFDERLSTTFPFKRPKPIARFVGNVGLLFHPFF